MAASALKIQEMVSSGKISPQDGANLLAIRRQIPGRLKEQQRKGRSRFLRIAIGIPVLLITALWAACAGQD